MRLEKAGQMKEKGEGNWMIDQGDVKPYLLTGRNGGDGGEGVGVTWSMFQISDSGVRSNLEVLRAVRMSGGIRSNQKYKPCKWNK